MELPSGDQLGSESPYPACVSNCAALFPSVSIVHSCPLKPTYTMWRPSGDQSGEVPVFEPFVRFVCPVPSAFTIQRSPLLQKTTLDPSGDQAGSAPAIADECVICTGEEPSGRTVHRSFPSRYRMRPFVPGKVACA